MSLLIDRKIAEGEHVHECTVVLLKVSFCEALFEVENSEARNVFAMTEQFL